MCSFIFIFLTVTDCMQNRLFVIVTQHSNSHVHEDLKFKFFIVKVFSSVVNMTSEIYNVLEFSIFLKN